MKKQSVREEVVTKGFLTDTLADFREGLIDQMDQRIETKFKAYTNKVLTGLDKVMKELETMREENAAGTLQARRFEEQVEDHEKRIKQLESAN